VTRLIALLVLAAAASADVETPLGPFARAGVLVALRSSEARVVTLDGWSYRLRAGRLEFLSAPRLPCSVLDDSGRERARLEPVPEGALLVGAVGVPADRLATALTGEGGGRVIVVALDPLRLVADWRPYDLFDLVVVAVPSDALPGDARVALSDWVLAGGELAVLGDRFAYLDPQGGLGRLRTERALDRLLASLGPVRPHRIPRPGGTRPDLYELVGPPVPSARPLRAARALVGGAAAALALLLTLGAIGRLRRAAIFGGAALVLVSSLLLGLLLPSHAYRPEARGRIEVVYAGERVARWRTYHVVTSLNPAARLPRVEGWLPILFRAASPPWWEGATGEAALPPGNSCIFLEERLAPPPQRPERPSDGPLQAASLRERPVLRLLSSEAQLGGEFSAWGSEGLEAPSNEGGGGTLLARLLFAPFH